MMELGFPRMTKVSLKEQSIRTTFRNVRLQRHPYIELRQEGKKLIFFCTICLAPCYNDSCLYDHLNGNPHTERLTALKATLFKPNPWPFNDGVFFFHSDSEDKSESLPSSDCEQNKVLDVHHADTNSLAMVKNKASIGPVDSIQNEDKADFDENGQSLVIPSVLREGEVSDLVVRKIGVGKIGARFSGKDGISSNIRRIWCEWLGHVHIINEDIHEHEFAVVTFSYSHNLSRMAFLCGFGYQLPSSPHSEPEDSSRSRCKRRTSFSDLEYSSEVANPDDSSWEESHSSSNSKSKEVFSGYDGQVIYSRSKLSKAKRKKKSKCKTEKKSKAMRKKLRKKHFVASERTCDLCKQKLLQNKDVAALLNRATGKLACSSRNSTGAFHVFHISCLIQWILFCEVEFFAKQSVEAEQKQKLWRVKGRNLEKHEVHPNQICSTYCPECQGTGIKVDGDDREDSIFSLSEIFWNKIKLCNARKAWIKSPETLENCSLGFNFPFKSDEIFQENVTPLKLLHFYRADDY